MQKRRKQKWKYESCEGGGKKWREVWSEKRENEKGKLKRSEEN